MCPDDPVLSSFVDHELPPGSSDRVEAHVTDCTHCRTRLRRYQSLSHRLLECDEPDVEEAATRIWRRIDGQAPVSSARRRGWLRLPIVAASAAVAIAFVFTFAVGDRPPALGEWGLPAAPSRTVALAGTPVPPYAGAEPVVLEWALPDASELRPFSSPAILLEIELQPSAVASHGEPTNVEVRLPPARYQIVGMPVIFHEAELQTAKP